MNEPRITTEIIDELLRDRQFWSPVDAHKDPSTSLVAMAVHDLRNGIQAAIAARDLLLVTTDRSLAQEALDILGAALDRLCQLLGDLCSATTGIRSWHPTPTDLIDRIGAALSATGIDPALTRWQIDSSHQVTIDPSHLYRIMTNLLSNACKYGRPPVEITISAVGATVTVEVADRGPGVPPAFVPRLFEPFTRAEAHRHAPGSGLGLAIVRELVHENGGEVAYRPNHPTGSVFMLHLLRYTEEPQPILDRSAL
jgi:signal transduction histidine kinase